MNYIEDNDNENEQEHELTYLLALGSVVMATYFYKYIAKQPCRTSSHTGIKFVMEILEGNSIRCQEQFRMEKQVFVGLCDKLRTYGLSGTQKTRIEEMVGMFLITLGHGLGNRMVQERFQHSGETISRHFDTVLKAVCKMSMSVIKPTDIEFQRTHDKIKNDDRYWPYFKNCVGAIDGTHVPAVLTQGKQIPFIGRKGIPTQNVMAACDFDMRFTFVWAGWEGSAHDTRIFLEAIRKEDLHFPHPPRGKFYLVDAGYPHMNGYLGPFKGERYHLPDFRRGSQPRGLQEVFNHAHSSLRCTIERTFGVWKNRWKILRNMPSYPYNKQVMIVVASMTLHNFIRDKSVQDLEFKQYDEDEDLLPNDEENSASVNVCDDYYDMVHYRLSKNEINEERMRIGGLLMNR